MLISSGSDPTRTVNLGEQIVFTIELTTRESLSGSLFVTTTIPEGTDYVPDSSASTQPGSSVSATTGLSGTLTAMPVTDAARRILRWQVQPMSAGQKFVVRYAVQVNRATNGIVASASALNSQTGQASTSNAVVLPTQPLAVTLLRFETHPHPLGIKIVWQTGQEIETFGFVLLRSIGTDRMSAVLITPKLIGAQGSGLGATYEYVDTGVLANQQYSYWLQEVAASGAVQDYGPLSAVAVSQSPQIVIAGSMVAGGVPLPVQVSGVDQKVVQTAEAVLQRNAAVPTQVVNQVSQVAVQPVASPVEPPNALQSEPTQTKPLQVVVPTDPPAPDASASHEADNANNQAAIPIATIEPVASSTAEVAPAATADPVVVDTATAMAPNEPTVDADANTATLASATPASVAGLPAAPAKAQVVAPQGNAAAPIKTNDESRNEGRWGPLNWLLAGLLACFGWLIISSFLAVAVGRYLKGRQ